MVDGFPMPVCKITRAYGNHCFKGEAAYGYYAAKDETYDGFEGQVLVSSEGVICSYTFAAANRDERDMLLEITQGLKGLLIGDKGTIRPSLKEELAKQALDLTTPLRRNMNDSRPKAAVDQLMKARRLVETVIGQLTERFHSEKVRTRDRGHLTNRFIRKCLAHTVGVFLNKWRGNQPLHFEALVEV
ncbi:MAG: IS982 family transposase [Dehalococcoidia bacterium]|nr:IS982 family transposase [Dehalococcoidia bacterium]